MSEIFSLPDGRKIEYKVYGDRSGFPIVWCHGLFGSVFADGIDDLFKGVPVCNIFIARPGYGGSDFFLMDNIARWPNIIKPLLEHLDVTNFDVVGISAGAAYAYATAAEFPDNVRNVYVNSGIGAIYKPEIMSLYPKEAEAEISVYQNDSLEEISLQIRDTYILNLSEEYKKLPYIRDSLVGGCMGVAACGKLEFMNWGFDIEGIEQPILMFHCRDDEEVPFAMAEETAKYLKNAKLMVHDTGGHVPPSLMKDMVNHIISKHRG